MSDLNFSVDPADLEYSASRLEKLKFEALGTSEILQNEVNTIKAGWQGADSEAYANQYAELHKRLNAAVDGINSVISSLRGAAQILRDYEENVKHLADLDPSDV